MSDLKLTKTEKQRIIESRDNLKEVKAKSKAFNKIKAENEDSVYHNRVTALKVDEEKMSKMYDLHQSASKDLNRNFGETFDRINKLYGITLDRIENEAHVLKKTTRKWKNGGYVGKRSVVRYAITFGLDLLVVETLLNSGGYRFDYSKPEEYAWAYLIMYYGGASLEECDRVLERVFGFKHSKRDDLKVFLTPVPRTKK